MISRFIILVLLTLIMTSCGDRFGVYSPSQIHRTVKPFSGEEGVYFVHYRYFGMIDNYGPGLKIVREKVDKAETYEERRTIWKEALESAVPAYMDEKGLIPIECINGIVIVRTDPRSQGGSGLSLFRCK